MTAYRDTQGHRIEIRQGIGGFMAKRWSAEAGAWLCWNLQRTFHKDRAEAQRRLDALAAKKGLVKEEGGT
jgi:hypothetical protein